MLDSGILESRSGSSESHESGGLFEGCVPPSTSGHMHPSLQKGTAQHAILYFTGEALRPQEQHVILYTPVM